MPYIYSAAHVGHLTSMPVLRAMPLVYPNDLKLANCMTEYMLGDSLLVTAFTDKVYLPAGKWIDYWTGAEHVGPKEMTCTWPKNRAGGLFIKAGAMIPCWPEMNFVGEVPVDNLKLHVYPEAQSDFTLYEDDGNSFDYIKAGVAKTKFSCESSQGEVTLSIAPRAGAYKGMPSTRSYEVWIHTAQPKSVTINGTTANWTYDAVAKAIKVGVTEDPARKQSVLVECK